jgi:hypothetical protein
MSDVCAAILEFADGTRDAGPALRLAGLLMVLETAAANPEPAVSGWFAAIADARLAARKAENDWLVSKLDEIHRHLLFGRYAEKDAEEERKKPLESTA